MTQFKYKPDTSMDHIPTAQLSEHGQLRRAFPLWTTGVYPESKMVGDVIHRMILAESEAAENDVAGTRHSEDIK